MLAAEWPCTGQQKGRLTQEQLQVLMAKAPSHSPLTTTMATNVGMQPLTPTACRFNHWTSQPVHTAAGHAMRTGWHTTMEYRPIGVGTAAFKNAART